eukprot:5531546-Heterocapsa_arctica.AAC.1
MAVRGGRATQHGGVRQILPGDPGRQKDLERIDEEGQRCKATDNPRQKGARARARVAAEEVLAAAEAKHARAVADTQEASKEHEEAKKVVEGLC